jgi:hypothetical protein
MIEDYLAGGMVAGVRADLRARSGARATRSPRRSGRVADKGRKLQKQDRAAR